MKLLLLTVSSEALQFLKIFKVRCTPNYSLLQLCLSSLVQKPGIFSYMLHFHYCLTKYEGQYLDIFNLPRNKNCDCSFLYIFYRATVEDNVYLILRPGLVTETHWLSLVVCCCCLLSVVHYICRFISLP